MSQTKTINIAKEFAEEPMGRFPSDGDNNGQRFRDEILLPALRANDKVVVILDGAEGYGSSFLEEAFGGLIRIGKLSQKEVLDRLELVSKEDESLIDEILEYINEAE